MDDKKTDMQPSEVKFNELMALTDDDLTKATICLALQTVSDLICAMPSMKIREAFLETMLLLHKEIAVEVKTEAQKRKLKQMATDEVAAN